MLAWWPNKVTITTPTLSSHLLANFLEAYLYGRVRTRMNVEKIFPQQYNIHDMKQINTIKDHPDEQKGSL